MFDEQLLETMKILKNIALARYREALDVSLTSTADGIYAFICKVSSMDITRLLCYAAVSQI